MRSQAPAKINVYLRLVGQRADGYHLVDSLMVPVSMYDDITLAGTVITRPEGRTSIALTCNDPTIPGDATNLAYRAAALLCQEAGVQARLTIHLHKRIPAGAGLGGGSSDAAAVLKGLNTLFALGLPESQLCALGVRLGADVPFFIPCRPALAAGIGEVLTAVPSLPPRWVVLVVPPFAVSTPWAYQRFDALPPQPQGHSPACVLARGQWPPAAWLANDLERAVIPEYPVLAHIKAQLHHHGADVSLMSGSGAAVFGMFVQRQQAEHAVSALQHYGRVSLVHILNGPEPPTAA